MPKKDASVLAANGEEKEALKYEMDLDKIKLLKLKDSNKVISTVDLTVKKDIEKVSILKDQ